MNLTPVIKTLAKLREEKQIPRYLKMNPVEREEFLRNFRDLASSQKLTLGGRRYLTDIVKGIHIGDHHAASGMCIIEDKDQKVLLILLEKNDL